MALSVSVGSDTTVNAGATDILLYATASGGTSPYTYSWAQTSGPSVSLTADATYDRPAGRARRFDAPSPVSETDLEFECEVRDAAGGRTSGTKTVTVRAKAVVANKAPTVTITGPTSADPGATVNLEAIASDPDGDTISYEWDSDDVTLKSTTGGKTSFEAPSSTTASTVTVTCKVTDDGSPAKSDTDSHKVSVGATKPAASPPSANAGSNKSVEPGGTVDLSGSGKPASGQQITAYSWSRISIDTGVKATLSPSNSATPTITAASDSADGDVEYRLKVTQTDKQTDTDDVVVSVSSANLPPTVTINGPDNVAAGADVVLEAVASDSDGTIVADSFSWTTNGPDLTTKTGSRTSFTAPSEFGSSTISVGVRVKDNDGAFGRDTHDIRVGAAVVGDPDADAGSDKSVLPSGTVDLVGSATPAAGTQITGQKWTYTKGTGGSISPTNALTTTFTAPKTEGEHECTLTVTQTGGKTDSDTVAISVESPNEDPTVRIIGQTTAKAGESGIALEADASDVDGEIASYAWSQTRGTTVSLSSTTGGKTSFDAPNTFSTHDLRFQCIVTDNDGGTGRDTHNVLVGKRNNAPVARATSPISEDPGDKVTLDGSGSTDADGDILTYSWAQYKASNEQSNPTVVLSGSSSAKASFTAPGNRTGSNYTLRFRLTVDDGTESDSDTTAVTIQQEYIERTDTIYRTSSSALSKPSGGTTNENHLPSGWSRTRPDPTATENVYRSRRTVYYTYPSSSSSFHRADTWGTPVKIADATGSGPNYTRLDEIWTLATSEPDPPSGGTSRISNPTGWSRTEPSPTPTENVYIANRTITFDSDDNFVKSTNWRNVSKVADATGDDRVGDPPIANAGANDTVNPGAAVRITGTGTPGSGTTIKSYAWAERTATGIRLSGDDQATVSFTAPNKTSPTTVTLRLTVEQSDDQTDTDEVTILVRPRPEANAGNDRDVRGETADTKLTGTGTVASVTGETTTIRAYKWEYVRGDGDPDIGDITNDTNANATFTTPVATNENQPLRFKLTVTDSARNKDDDEVVLTVLPKTGSNERPVADAGGDFRAAERTEVTLDGTGSTDKDGTIQTYDWQQDTNNPVSVTLTTNANEEGLAKFTAPPATANDITLKFKLRVQDDDDAWSDVDEVDVTIFKPTQFMVNVGPNFTLNPGQEKILTAVASGPYAVDDDSWFWGWNVSSAEFRMPLDGDDTDTVTFTADEQTTQQRFVLQAIAQDVRNNESTDNAVVTIRALPTADPGNNRSEAGSASVTLDGSGSAVDTTYVDAEIVGYEWSQVSGTTVTITDDDKEMASFTAPQEEAEDQELEFRLVVTDNHRNTSDAKTVIITVPGADDPTANAGNDQNVNGGVRVNIAGTATAVSPATITSTEWVQASGPDVDLDDKTSLSTFFMAPAAVPGLTRAVILDLVVTDSNNKKHTDRLRIGIRGLPVVEAGTYDPVDGGSTVKLNGSATATAPATIVSYEWRRKLGPAIGTITHTDKKTGVASFTAPPSRAHVRTVEMLLTATDSNNQSNTDIAIINVRGRGAISAGEDQTVNPGDTVNLSGTYTPVAPLTIRSVKWTRQSGPAISITDSTMNDASFVAPSSTSVQTSRVRFTGTNSVNTSTFDNLDITIRARPVANAGANKSNIAAGSKVEFTGSGTVASVSGETATITELLWRHVSGPNVEIVPPETDGGNWHFIAPQSRSAQTVQLGLVAVDNFSNESTEDLVSFGINKSVDPAANAGDDKTWNPGQTVQLLGSGTSPNGGETLRWLQVSGPSVTINNPTSGAATFNPLARDSIQTFVMRLTVTDGLDLTDTDDVTMTVRARPVAEAGDNQSNIEAGTTVDLTGSGTVDSNTSFPASISSYDWDQESGPTVMLMDDTKAATTFVAPSEATPSVLQFKLTVTDDHMNEDDDTVVITVLPANKKPIALAGDDQTVGPADIVTLDGSRSVDPEGSALTYKWTQDSGTSVTLSDDTAVKNTFTAPESLSDEDLVFSLVVTDEKGLASTADTVTITVEAINLAPVADAGDDQNVSAGAKVTLDGSASRDPEGEPLSYLWSQTGGTTVTLSGDRTASPTFTAPSGLMDTLTFFLRVEDNKGTVDGDSVDIVVGAANQQPIADGGGNQSVPRGVGVVLDGTASYDPDAGDMITHSWDQISGPTVALSGGDTSTATFTSPRQFERARLVFRLTVTDDGTPPLSATDDVTIDVGATNAPPTADAGSNQTVQAGATVTVDGSLSTDPDGVIQSYAWTQVSGPTVSISNANKVTARFIAPTQNAASVVVLRVTVRDDEGGTDDDEVRIDVAAVSTAANIRPTARAGPDKRVPAGTTVILDGSRSTDPDGSIVSYQWAALVALNLPGESSTRLQNANTARATYVAETPNNPNQLSARTFKRFTLTVTDNRGATSTDNLDVYVGSDASNLPPSVNAGPNRTVSAGESVDLDGTGSTDSDGTIQSYFWTQSSGPQVLLKDNITSTPTFIAPSLQEKSSLVFKLECIDDDGAMATDTVTIDVVPLAPLTNLPPTANAGQNRTAQAGETIVLDGSLSLDLDGVISAFEWEQLIGFGDSVVELLGPDTSGPSFEAPSTDFQQTLVFQLTVTDDRGATDTDTVSIAVAPQPIRSQTVPTITRSDTIFTEVETVPAGKFMTMIRDQLVVAGDPDHPYRVYYSALGNAQDFVPSDSTLAGFQDMEAQYGRVVGLVPGRFGYVFQENAVVRMTGVSPPVVFRYDPVEKGRGLLAEASLTWVGDRVFWYSEEGFYQLVPGQEAMPIGAFKVEQWVKDNVLDLRNMVGVAHPTNHQILWSVQLYTTCPEEYDAILVYDWFLEQWGLILQEHQRLAVHWPGDDVELPESDEESEDLLGSDNIFDIPGSFGDAQYEGAITGLFVFNTKRQRGVFGTGAKRMFVKTGSAPIRRGSPPCTMSGVRPIVDYEYECDGPPDRVEVKVAEIQGGSGRVIKRIVNRRDGVVKVLDRGRFIEISYESDNLVRELSGFELYSRPNKRFTS